MDKLNNLEDVKRFLHQLGIHMEEAAVRQVVNVLSGKVRQSLYSLFAIRQDKPAPVCGKGSVYKIKKLYDEGKLKPYLDYLKVIAKEDGNQSAIIKPKYAEVENDLDAPWQFGLSKSNDVLAEAIPWLMELQLYRKTYCSKPITIREAKWFSRLSGFRQTFSDLSDFLTASEIHDDKIRNSFLWNVIATWAKLYAYREKLDTTAGIEKTDYSDLDSYMGTNSLKALDEYNNKWSLITVKRIANEVEITREDLEKFNVRYMMSSNIDNVRSGEIYFLAHSLGDPEMTDSAIDLYSHAFTIIFLDLDGFSKRLLKLPYILRIRFLVNLRRWISEHPDELKSSIEPVIGQIMEKVEKSSHSEIDST